MRHFIVTKAHPFFRHSQPFIVELGAHGPYRVKWRDFMTEKQDRDFDTRGEAEAFARTVNAPPLRIPIFDEDGLDDPSPEDLSDADAFWKKVR